MDPIRLSAYKYPESVPSGFIIGEWYSIMLIDFPGTANGEIFFGEYADKSELEEHIFVEHFRMDYNTGKMMRLGAFELAPSLKHLVYSDEIDCAERRNLKEILGEELYNEYCLEKIL